VTEDSGSGFEFWVHLSRIALKKVKVISCSGFYGVHSAVERIGIRNGDIVILALDKIEYDDTVFSNYYKVQEYVNEAGVGKVMYLDTYCFEEIILSFRFLLDWCDFENIRRKNKDIDIKILYTVRKHIYAGSEYMDSEDIEKYMLAEGLNYSEESKRERFAYYFLNRITYGSSFSYKKGRLSPCYYIDCCSMKYPKHCGIKKKNSKTTGINKSKCIYRNSILSRKRVLRNIFG
jgi:hypothetical protein